MINNFEKFSEIFNDIAAAMEEVKAVVFVTDWREIQEWQKHDSVYPCLVIELPDVTVGSEEQTDTFETNWSIIDGCGKDETPEYYQGKLGDTFELVKLFRKRLYCIDGEDGVCITESEKFSPIVRSTSDYCFGWRSDSSTIKIQNKS